MKSWILLFYLIISNTTTGMKGNLICLSCREAVTPSDCGEITYCGPHGRCFVDQFVTSVGTVRYNLGCRDTAQCLEGKAAGLFGRRSVSGLMVCSECCNGTLCNNQACGQKGYGDRTQRGAVCASCPTQGFDDDCNKVTVCGRDQVCSLRRLYHSTTQKTYYKTECMDRQRCIDDVQQLQMTLQMIGKRDTSEVTTGGKCLLKCCDEDLCNIKCNSTEPSVSSPVLTSTPLTVSSLQTLATKKTSQVIKTSSTAAPLSSSTLTSHPHTTAAPHPIFTAAPHVSSTATPHPHATAPPNPFLTAAPHASFAPTPVPNYCAPQPCVHGTCFSGLYTYTCHCYTGYYGERCSNVVGCSYRGKVYRTGEKWRDGCFYLCTCVDGRTGQYRCTPLCPRWNLPPVCFLRPPAPRFCCSVPDCPSYINVVYPDNYVPY